MLPSVLILSGVIWPDLLFPQFLVALAVSISISASAGDVKLNHLHKIRLKTSSKSIEISLSGSFKSVLFLLRSGRLKLRTTAAESWKPESHEGW